MLGASRAARIHRRDTAAPRTALIAAAATIVFLFTFTSFGVALLLAGVQHPTLEVEIYRQALEVLDLSTAAALALVQMIAVLALLLVLARLQETRTVGQRLVARADTARRPRTWAERATVVITVSVVTLFLAAPLAVLVARSFHVGDTWGLASYRALGNSACYEHVVRSRVGGGAQLVGVRGGGNRDRRGRRRTRRLRDRRPARTRHAGDGRAPDAPARHVGGHGRARFPRRARPASPGSPYEAAAGPHRAGGGRDPVRRRARRARAPQHRSAAARRGDGARRVAGTSVARGRPPRRVPGP